MKLLAMAFAILLIDGKKTLVYLEQTEPELIYYNLTRDLRLKSTDPFALVRERSFDGLAKQIAGLKKQGAVNAIDLQSPLPQGTHHLCAGLNYADHAAESGQAPELVLFPKFGAVTGQSASVPLRNQSALPELLDYEVELGVSFDRDIRTEADLKVAQAGFFIVNDVSDRALQIFYHGEKENHASYSFAAAKSRPGYSVVSPVLVIPRDWREFAQGLELKLWVNDELRQQSSTARMAEPIEAMVLRALRTSPEVKWPVLKSEQGLELGAEKTLLPLDENGRLYMPHGMIFMTGTPAGTIFRKPGFGEMVKTFFSVPAIKSPLPDLTFKKKLRVSLIERLAAQDKFLRAGDRVRSTIQNLGNLDFSVEAKSVP